MSTETQSSIRPYYFGTLSVEAMQIVSAETAIEAMEWIVSKGGEWFIDAEFRGLDYVFDVKSAFGNRIAVEKDYWLVHTPRGQYQFTVASPTDFKVSYHSAQEKLSPLISRTRAQGEYEERMQTLIGKTGPQRLTWRDTGQRVLDWEDMITAPGAYPTTARSWGESAPLEYTNQVITAHSKDQCFPNACSLHNRSSHRLRHMPQAWDDTLQLVVRVCGHGNQHIDPDNPGYSTYMQTHTCPCDCCRR